MAASIQHIATVALSQCATVIFHPIGHAKILIQLGHEPIAPILGRNIFRKEFNYYPNVLQYAGHIWTTDGFLGMYTGLLPRILGSFAGTYVQSSALEWLRQDDNKENGEVEVEEDGTDWIKSLCIKTGQETVAKCCGIIASQPFHVIMIRQMAQFVGGEKIYCGLFPSIGEVYRADGIKGFFSGLVPRLLLEVIQIWFTNLIVGSINKYGINTKEAQAYVPLFVGFAVSNFTYPFTVVANVMAVSGTELMAAQTPNMKPYSNWLECWGHLRETNNLSRGSKMFWRVANLQMSVLRRAPGQHFY